MLSTTKIRCSPCCFHNLIANVNGHKVVFGAFDVLIAVTLKGHQQSVWFSAATPIIIILKLAANVLPVFVATYTLGPMDQ